MNRSVQEVTFMAAKLKEPSQRVLTDSVAEAIVQEATKKVKKVIEEKVPLSETTSWSQEQQKLLETAIVKYPKTTAGDRWQKIANTVPGKTKEECLARYKYLVQKVKEQQKLKEAAAQQESEEKPQKPDDIEDQQPVDRVENVEQDDNNAEEEEEAEPEPVVVEKKTGGKPRNKRKERKKRMDFSSDEDNYDYE